MDNPLLLFCPYPTVHEDGMLLDGISMPQTKYCKTKCEKRECAALASGSKDGEPAFHTCSKGFSVGVVKIGDLVIRINGVVEANTSTAPNKFKKHQRDRKLKLPELEQWLRAFCAIRPEYEKRVQAKANDAVHALHDIKSLIGSVLNTAEQYIFKQHGESMDDKIKASPLHLQTIYHSCEVLQSLLQITDILTNPTVAQFGTPRPASVHGAILKLIRIHEDRTHSQGKTLILKGDSYNQVKLYSSFIIIPHILIDNAIKHADRDTQIHILVQDKDSGEIKVDFSSFGYLIPESERDRVFQRAFRGSNARAPGSGLGLYIAQIVAKANGFEIYYKAQPTGILGNNKGYNHFMFTVPVSAPEQPRLSSTSNMPLSTRSAYW